MSFDLSTRYLGMELANPLVASSSPLTGRIDSLLELEAAGAAAVVLPSLFEEQVEEELRRFEASFEAPAEQFGEAPGGYLPQLETYNTGVDRYLETLRRAKAELTVPVIASLNGISTGGWTHYASLLEIDGADAIELNVFVVATDHTADARTVEDEYVRLVSDIRAEVSLPIAVKIGPFFSSVAHFAHQLIDAGANGIVLFNRFYHPDIDLDELAVVPRLDLSSSTELGPVLRWLAILHGTTDASLAATSGVHTGADAVKAVLAGADVAMTTSAVLRHGTGQVAVILAGLRDWLAEQGYASVAQARGSLSLHASPDPAAYERANYLQSLTSLSAATLRAHRLR